MSPPDICDRGIAQVIEAMKNRSLDRLICMTAIGVGNSQGHGTWMFRHAIRPLMLGRIFKDRENQEAKVMRSGLGWTIVRPAKLIDGAATGRYRTAIGLGDLIAKPITRAEVADFLVQVAGDTEAYVHQTPLVDEPASTSE